MGVGGALLEDLPGSPQTILHAEEKFMQGPPVHLLQEDSWLFPSLTSFLCSLTGWFLLRITAKESTQDSTSHQLIWNETLKSLRGPSFLI